MTGADPEVLHVQGGWLLVLNYTCVCMWGHYNYIVASNFKVANNCRSCPIIIINVDTQKKYIFIMQLHKLQYDVYWRKGT